MRRMSEKKKDIILKHKKGVSKLLKTNQPATSYSSGISRVSFSMAMSLRGPRITMGRLKLAGENKQTKNKTTVNIVKPEPLCMTPSICVRVRGKN